MKRLKKALKKHVNAEAGKGLLKGTRPFLVSETAWAIAKEIVTKLWDAVIEQEQDSRTEWYAVYDDFKLYTAFEKAILQLEKISARTEFWSGPVYVLKNDLFKINDELKRG